MLMLHVVGSALRITIASFRAGPGRHATPLEMRRESTWPLWGIGTLLQKATLVVLRWVTRSLEKRELCIKLGPWYYAPSQV
jgi:hypothetical protein